MNIRLMFVFSIVSLVFLGYFIVSGNYKLSETIKPEKIVESNQAPIDVFREYTRVLIEAKKGEELLPYHPADFVKVNKYNYKNMDDFLAQEKYYFSLKNIKVLGDNMNIANPVKKIDYVAWHVASRNRITGSVAMKKVHGKWIILTHNNEVRQNSR